MKPAIELKGGLADAVPQVILAGMTSRVGPKGQVVIPKMMRDALGIHPGDEVDFALEDSSVRVEPVKDRPSLGGRYKHLALTEELMKDRRRERRR